MPALAGELGLSLFTIQLDNLITKYMGENAAKLRLVFDAIQATRGVYLFDRFDAFGEIRRVLNSSLQFLEMDNSDGAQEYERTPARGHDRSGRDAASRKVSQPMNGRS